MTTQLQQFWHDLCYICSMTQNMTKLLVKHKAGLPPKIISCTMDQIERLKSTINFICEHTPYDPTYECVETGEPTHIFTTHDEGFDVISFIN